MIRFDNVSKHYLKHGATIRALQGITLEAPRGALTLVRGHSGCGKTTLIDLAAGLARPTAGDVSIDGASLNRMTGPQLARLRARRVAVVFQLFHLVPYLTALENVLLPSLAAPCADAGRRAQDLLERLGILERAQHRPAELSAGERQRCALARALLQQPEVLLADEPTGNLDEESAKRVIDTLDACRNNGVTVLLASHQHLEHIRADQEFTLDKGSLLL